MFGSLPDFIILGAQKGGTTSLYYWLSQHPQVRAVRGSKEIHYFDDQYAKPLLWYRLRFPSRARLWLEGAARRQRVITGEASPYYLVHPHVPRRIARDAPSARLVVLLRDPALRAYSHYRHNFRMGWETLPFGDALAQEPERTTADWSRLLADERHLARDFRKYSYRARGRYLEQIERVERDCAGNPLLILRSEDLFDRPEAEFRKVLDFLGLDAFTPPDMKAMNEGDYDQVASEVDDLRQYFAPLNSALERHLGRSFAWN